MQKNQVVCYFDNTNFFRLVQYASKNGCKTLSQATDKILKEYFFEQEDRETALQRLHKALADRDNRIKNLEHDLRQTLIAQNTISSGNKGVGVDGPTATATLP